MVELERTLAGFLLSWRHVALVEIVADTLRVARVIPLFLGLGWKRAQAISHRIYFVLLVLWNHAENLLAHPLLLDHVRILLDQRVIVIDISYHGLLTD